MCIHSAGSCAELGGTPKRACIRERVTDINGRAERAHNSDIRKTPVVITALSLVPDQCVPLQINDGRLPASADGLKSAFFRPGRLDTSLSVLLLKKALDL